MNSSDVPTSNGILEDEGAGSSSISNPDRNANLNDGVDRSRGAIPKIKTSSKPLNSSQRKSIKLNNNIEEMHTLNGVINECTEEVKKNGFDKECRTTEEASFMSVYDDHEICENVAIDDKVKFSNRKRRSFDYQSSQIEFDLPVNFHALCLDKNKTTDDSENSSDDTELLSISDDGCIYTYKGDNVADLPESFFSLDIPILENQEVVNDQQRNSSPEMDFLEMDFDPGPAGDIDSDSVSNSDVEQIKVAPITNIADKEEEYLASGSQCLVNCHQEGDGDMEYNAITIACKRTSENVDSVKTQEVKSRRTENIKMPWSCVLSERTTGLSCLRTIRRQHNSSGELVSPVDQISPTGDQTCSICTSHLQKPMPSIKRTMIWSEEEAKNIQIMQIGASACGATAVLNVLKALRFPLPSREKVQEAVHTRLRANSSPFVDYLLSRSTAGTTHEDLIAGLHKLSDGNVFARFFPMYPERVVNLNMWLSFWIENGAVPIATLNLQKGIQPIPDAWHHQMIFGVSEEGIHLTNPLECVRAEDLWPQLCSDSVLLIKREDVLSRWNREEFVRLMKLKDVRWRRLNVVGEFRNGGCLPIAIMLNNTNVTFVCFVSVQL